MTPLPMLSAIAFEAISLLATASASASLSMRKGAWNACRLVTQRGPGARSGHAKVDLTRFHEVRDAFFETLSGCPPQTSVEVTLPFDSSETFDTRSLTAGSLAALSVRDREREGDRRVPTALWATTGALASNSAATAPTRIVRP